MKARGGTKALTFILLHLLLSTTPLAANTAGPILLPGDPTSTSTPAANTAGGGVVSEAVTALPTLIPRQNKLKGIHTSSSSAIKQPPLKDKNKPPNVKQPPPKDKNKPPGVKQPPSKDKKKPHTSSTSKRKPDPAKA
jgi:hypothetical protein